MKSNLKLESLISGEFVAVSETETVASAVDFLRKSGFQNKFAYIYVIDEKNKLTGILQTRDLLVADPAKQINLVMKKSILSISQDASLEKLVELFNLNSFLTVPVIDSDRQLIGIISRKNLESKLKQKGLIRLRSKSSADVEEVEGSNVFEIVLKRLPWLVISVTSGLVCAYILGIFIGKIESIVALILFVPVILGLAGNVGTQSARVTSRGLEEGRLSITKLIFILGKESVVGFLIAICILILSTAIALLWKRYPIEGIALSLSIMAVSITSGMMGIILPVTFKTLRMSGKLASGLFVLLICDIVALILYFLISLSFVSPTLIIT